MFSFNEANVEDEVPTVVVAQEEPLIPEICVLEVQTKSPSVKP
jgi:hypothetical protein